MKFEEILGEFTEKIGIGTAGLDEDGSIALLFDGEHDITFTPTADDNSILLHCEIGDAGNLDKESFIKLFRASLLGAETGGAAFGVQADPDRLVLWKRHDNDFADCAMLEKVINAFLAQVMFWKEQLGSPSASENEEASSNLSDFMAIPV